MKTRSRASRTAATLLAALLTAPLASVPSATAGDYPAGERINPATLERGASTPLLRLVGRTIVDGETTVKVTGSPTVTLVGRVGEDYLVLTSDLDQQEPHTPGWQLRRVTRAGEQAVLFEGSDSQPEQAHLAEGGAHVVLGSERRTGSVLRVLDTTTGDLVTRRAFSFVSVLGFAPRRMVVSRWETRSVRARTFWWNPFRDRLTRIAGVGGYIADVSTDRLGLITEVHDEGGCQKVVRLSRPREVIWRSCDDLALAFSPTGRRMVTSLIFMDGPPPGLVQVRGAHGRLLDTYRAEWFGAIHWESDRRLLLQAAGRKTVAMTRCTLRSCERISPLCRLGDREPWEVMPVWQFADESLRDR
ncbi:MAG TPA: hypothetical protein VFR87_20575 [Nocardioidaceae bacterium]|nr:hypothetical protein [Nocardioidaceae bacterium]